MSTGIQYHVNGNPRDFQVTLGGHPLYAMEAEFRMGRRFAYDRQPDARGELYAALAVDVIDLVHIEGEFAVLQHHEAGLRPIEVLDGTHRAPSAHLILNMSGSVCRCTLNEVEHRVTAVRVKQTVARNAEVEIYYVLYNPQGEATEYRLFGTLYTPRNTEEAEPASRDYVEGEK